MLSGGCWFSCRFIKVLLSFHHFPLSFHCCFTTVQLSLHSPPVPFRFSVVRLSFHARSLIVLFWFCGRSMIVLLLFVDLLSFDSHSVVAVQSFHCLVVFVFVALPTRWNCISNSVGRAFPFSFLVRVVLGLSPLVLGGLGGRSLFPSPHPPNLLSNFSWSWDSEGNMGIRVSGI